MLNWLREKLFKRPSFGTRTRNSRDNSDNRNQVLTINNSSSALSLSMISEEATNPDDKVILIIVSCGEVWTVDVCKNQIISDLIDMSTSHFFDPTECLTSRYKFISVAGRKMLNPQCTVGDEELKNNDELLLVPIISTVDASSKKLKLKDIKGPSEEEIINATAFVARKNPVQIIPMFDCQENFQFEIRKVLYSLVEASAKILVSNDDSKAVFDGIVARISSKMKKEIDKNAVKFLKDMGFSEYQARHALRLKRNRQIDAMEWLLENSQRVKEVVEEEVEEEAIASTSAPDTEDTPLQSIRALLHDIINFHKRYFEVSQKACDNLIAMGFDMDDVVEALRVTHNNQVSACEWLCGERGSSVTDPPVSLNVDGQLYKALMINPVIQLGLHNPKILLAFLSILENPSSANLWLNDVDAAPVLGQIFKTYHSEKHMMTVNQQVEMVQGLQAQS